jgi:hypothetical protein
VPTAVTRADVLAELLDLTSITPPGWADFEKLDAAGQALALELYRGASWTKVPSTLERVVVLVEALVTLAGDVSGVAGAVAAVRGLGA